MEKTTWIDSVNNISKSSGISGVLDMKKTLIARVNDNSNPVEFLGCPGKKKQ